MLRSWSIGLWVALASGCLETPGPAELRLDLSRCVGLSPGGETCGDALAARVAEGANACLVVQRASGARAHARWRWPGGVGGQLPALDLDLGLDERLSIAVFFFSAPIDQVTCEALGPQTECAGACVAQLLMTEVTASSGPLDFTLKGRCRLRGPVAAAPACAPGFDGSG
ncbi:MAG: hypothetical protein KC620_24360 [Myxococcales bacterium]|nr:hypothetical protein [Myxococcales bacterium]